MYSITARSRPRGSTPSRPRSGRRGAERCRSRWTARTLARAPPSGRGGKRSSWAAARQFGAHRRHCRPKGGDLYYRLGVFPIHLPPLRERREDLPLLVRHYLRRFSRELGRDVQEVAPEVLERLCDYSWPGNIRELQSVLKQALLRASGPILLPAFLPEFTGTPSGPRPAAPGAVPTSAWKDSSANG